MAKKAPVRAQRAEHGEKMIELKIRFWTDNIAPKQRVLPKNAWTAGVVRMERNQAHGVTPTGPVPFNSLLELSVAIEKTLIANDIVLHPNRRMRKYCK